MTVFIVERFGVDQQGIFGIFSTEEKANNALKIAKLGETDNYHSFQIEELTVDNIQDYFNKDRKKI